MSATGNNRRRGVIAAAVRRRSVRWALVIIGGAVALVLLARPAAIGGDLLSNVGPASQLQDGALMDAHPLGHYVLDHHFSAVKAGVLSGVDVSGIPPTIAWFLSNTLWQLTAFIAHALITLFTFAFSLDLVNGSGATGGASALEPVSRAVRSIYQQTFGEPWLIVSVLLAGLWAIYNALVRRRYVETAGSLAVSVVYVVIALAFVTQPERTIGAASAWSNAMSGAFLSLTSQGSLADQGRAKQGAADQLFTLLVYEPWTVLQFGGREHCVRSTGAERQQSVAVRPLSTDPARDGTLSRRLQRTDGVIADGKVCVSDRNKHAPRFLRFGSGSDERDKLYDALKDGDKDKLDDDDPAKRDASYRLGPADKPAAEAMGKGGQYERLLMAIVVFAGELGIFLLLGALSVAVILAQVLVLLLLAFSPVALVVGVFPGRGHQFFVGWLSRLVGFVVRKAIYSLILAVLLAVGAAISEATSSLGWLMAFGLQAAFYWSVFLFRHQLAGQLSLATTGTKSGPDSQAVRLASLYAVARIARRSLPGSSGFPARRGRAAGPTAGPSDPPDDTPPPPDADEPGAPPNNPPPNRPVADAAPTPRADAENVPDDRARTTRSSVDTPPDASTARVSSSPVGVARTAGDAPPRGGSADQTSRAPDAAAPSHGTAAPNRQDPSARREGRGRTDGSPATPRPGAAASPSSATGRDPVPVVHPASVRRTPNDAAPHPERGVPEAGSPLERELQGDAKRLHQSAPRTSPRSGAAEHLTDSEATG